MADQDSEVILLPEQDAGGSFRAEMFLKNMLMGYWKHLLAVVCVALLGLLFFGMNQNAYIDSQKAASAARGKIVAHLKKSMPEDFNPVSPSEEGLQLLKKTAQELEAIGARTEGVSAAESFLQAADFFRLAGDIEGQRRSYEGASQRSNSALVRFSVALGLANLEDDHQRAVEALQKAESQLKGLYAQRLAVARAERLEESGQKSEALVVYTDFLSKWPGSELNAQVQRRLSSLSSELSP